MHQTHRAALALSLCLAGAARAATVRVDPPMSNCSVIEDFNDGANSATGTSATVEFDSATLGTATYLYAANAAPEGFIELLPSEYGWEPRQFAHLRARFRIRRNGGEGPCHVEMYPSPVAEAPDGAGHRTVLVAPSDRFSECAFDLASATPPLNPGAIDGSGLRVDPFNYPNDASADAVDLDYILVDRGRVLGSEFDRDGDFGGFPDSVWRPVNIADAKVESGSLRGRATTEDPICNVESPPLIDTSVFRYVEVRMKSDRPGQAQLFFQNAAGPMGDPPEKDPVFDVPGDGEFHVYLLDFSDDGFWKAGPVTNIRLDPINVEGAAFEVDYVRVMEAVEVP